MPKWSRGLGLAWTWDHLVHLDLRADSLTTQRSSRAETPLAPAITADIVSGGAETRNGRCGSLFELHRPFRNVRGACGVARLGFNRAGPDERDGAWALPYTRDKVK
jgi:hypothetical protein